MPDDFKFPPVTTGPDTTDPVAILKAARAVLAAEPAEPAEPQLARATSRYDAHWTRGSLAEPDPSGNVCFCATGALAYAAGWRPQQYPIDTHHLSSPKHFNEGPGYAILEQDPDDGILHPHSARATQRALKLLADRIIERGDYIPWVGDRVPPPLSVVVYFNDRTTRTRAEVVQLFDETIAQAEA